MRQPKTFRTNLTTDPDADLIIVTVVGDFESATVPAFEAATARVLDLGSMRIALDLADVDLIDSAAIGAIMRLRQRAQAADLPIDISAPRAYQKRLFEITGLTHILCDPDPEISDTE